MYEEIYPGQIGSDFEKSRAIWPDRDQQKLKPGLAQSCLPKTGVDQNQFAQTVVTILLYQAMVHLVSSNCVQQSKAKRSKSEQVCYD